MVEIENVPPLFFPIVIKWEERVYLLHSSPHHREEKKNFRNSMEPFDSDLTTVSHTHTHLHTHTPTHTPTHTHKPTHTHTHTNSMSDSYFQEVRVTYRSAVTAMHCELVTQTCSSTS